jgi:hypothetical protein
MTKLLCTGLVALGLAVSFAQAGDHKHGGPECTGPACEVPAQKVQVTYVEQTITAYRTEVREREVTLMQTTIVTEDVPIEERCVLMPLWSDEIQTRTVPMPVARKEVRLVPVCHWVSECVTDPKTGCTYTMCHQVTELKPVTSTHVETVPIRMDSLKEVVSMVEEIEKYQPPGVILKYEVKPVKVKQHYLVTVPYKRTIKVPVYIPCPDCPTAAEHVPATTPDAGQKQLEVAK